jgi:hypothetical protein
VVKPSVPDPELAYGVGVGTMIAHGPLRRSGRAELPHPAPLCLAMLAFGRALKSKFRRLPLPA